MQQIDSTTLFTLFTDTSPILFIKGIVSVYNSVHLVDVVVAFKWSVTTEQKVRNNTNGPHITVIILLKISVCLGVSLCWVYIHWFSVSGLFENLGCLAIPIFVVSKRTQNSLKSADI